MQVREDSAGVGWNTKAAKVVQLPFWSWTCNRGVRRRGEEKNLLTMNEKLKKNVEIELPLVATENRLAPLMDTLINMVLPCS